jgi:hypothetical protein
MRVTTAMLADAATVESGKLYVFGGGWDSILARDFPMRHPVMALALVFQIDIDEAEGLFPFLIELVDEQDQRITSAEGQGVVDAPLGERTTFPLPTAISFVGVVFNRPGEYRFQISSGDDELATLPFSVRQAPEALDAAATQH